MKQLQTQTTTLTVERPREAPLVNQILDRFLHQIVETTEEAHPAWEGQFEKVEFEYYCTFCDHKGPDVCNRAVRCLQSPNQPCPIPF